MKYSYVYGRLMSFQLGDSLFTDKGKVRSESYIIFLVYFLFFILFLIHLPVVQRMDKVIFSK